MTNATFTWIPQAGILAQEVWYGRLTDVGATLPPSAGWNQGNNLYSATANSALIPNLDENTKYQFAVLEHCSQGSAPWSIITKYKLVCPVVSVVSHSGSLDVTLTIANASELAKIVSSLVLNLIDPSTGNPVSGANFSGSQITATITQTFSSLSPGTPYLVSVGYTLFPGGPMTVCSTTAVNTAALAPCTAPNFTISNITTTGFVITPSGLVGGDTYDVFLNTSPVAVAQTSGTYSAIGLTPGVTYSVVVRRNCSGGGSGSSSPQNVTTTTALNGTINLSTPQSNVSFQQVVTVNVTFPTPTISPITLYLGYTRRNLCNPCAGGYCSWSNGYDIFTPPSGAQNCPGVPTGDGYSGPPHLPFVVNVPAGVTSYSQTNIFTTLGNPGPSGGVIGPWLSLDSTSGQGFTDLYVKINSPSGYIPALTYLNGGTISGVTLHNITS